MKTSTIGNDLYNIANRAWLNYFKLGELIQLSHEAFKYAIEKVDGIDYNPIVLTFPIGLDSTGQAMMGESNYNKDQLIALYKGLSENDLPLNGIYSLVTGTEALLGDIVRTIILAYPKKLEGKRTISLDKIVNCQSIESVHSVAADSLIHDLTYKSPKEFAESITNIISFDLLQIPAFHQYIEVKATRDIYIHNQGIANDIYISKAGSHARVAVGDKLPVNIPYFLGAYECCISLGEKIKKELHQIWPSTNYDLEIQRSKSKSTTAD